MKATFQRGGVLVVYPENQHEAENLSRWFTAYQEFSGEALLQVITEYPWLLTWRRRGNEWEPSKTVNGQDEEAD